MSNSPAKTWIFVLNNPTDHDVELVKSWEVNTKRFVVSKEVGESGTPHLQAAVTWATAKRLTALKKLHSRVHWEKAVAREDAFLYPKKEGSLILVDSCSGSQGKRSDLAEAISALKEGKSVHEVWHLYPTTMVRYHRGIEAAAVHLAPKRVKTGWDLSTFRIRIPTEDLGKKSLICHGKPGIGKTELAKSVLPGALWVTHMDDLGNFVAGEHTGIIFDDMEFGHLPRVAQIHLLDCDNDRSIHVRYKTAHIPAGTKKIFTTNTPEGRIVDLDDGAIERRVTIVDLGSEFLFYA